MKQEMKLATAENIVSAICFGIGALLVVLALHTLSTVKSVTRQIRSDTARTARWLPSTKNGRARPVRIPVKFQR